MQETQQNFPTNFRKLIHRWYLPHFYSSRPVKLLLSQNLCHCRTTCMVLCHHAPSTASEQYGELPDRRLGRCCERSSLYSTGTAPLLLFTWKSAKTIICLCICVLVYSVTQPFLAPDNGAYGQDRTDRESRGGGGGGGKRDTGRKTKKFHCTLILNTHFAHSTYKPTILCAACFNPVYINFVKYLRNCEKVPPKICEILRNFANW